MRETSWKYHMVLLWGEPFWFLPSPGLGIKIDIKWRHQCTNSFKQLIQPNLERTHLKIITNNLKKSESKCVILKYIHTLVSNKIYDAFRESVYFLTTSFYSIIAKSHLIIWVIRLSIDNPSQTIYLYDKLNNLTKHIINDHYHSVQLRE